MLGEGAGVGVAVGLGVAVAVGVGLGFLYPVIFRGTDVTRTESLVCASLDLGWAGPITCGGSIGRGARA